MLLFVLGFEKSSYYRDGSVLTVPVFFYGLTAVIIRFCPEHLNMKMELNDGHTEMIFLAARGRSAESEGICFMF